MSTTRCVNERATLDTLIPLIAILPFPGFAITALIGRRLGKQAHWIPVLAVFAAWVIAMLASYNVLTGAAPLAEGSEDLHAYVGARSTSGSRLARSASRSGSSSTR